MLPWEYSMIKVSPNRSGLFVLRDCRNSIVFVGTAKKSQTIQQKLFSLYRGNRPLDVCYFDWYLVDKDGTIDALKKNWETRYSVA